MTAYAPVQLLAIPDGLAGTDATLRAMRQFIITGSRDPSVRQFTAKLIAGIRPQKSTFATIGRIFDFVRDHVAYIPDILDVETLHGAPFILEHRYGDCDDKTILLLAMLRSVGFTTQIDAILVGNNGHVIGSVVMGPGRFYYLDATENVPAGWFPPGRWPIHKSLRVD